MIDKLNQRTNKFTIVLNENGLGVFKNCKFICERLINSEKLDACYVAVIKHDRDIDELNHVKTVHYHVVLEINKTCRVGTMLNFLVSLFPFSNENQITIDKCNSVAMQTRYLLHLDEFDKVRYYDSEVVTNNVDYLHECLNLVKIRDMKDLVARVKEYHYDLELCMTKIVHFDKWRRYILDLIHNYNRNMRI